jgi:hypothetical protein
MHATLSMYTKVIIRGVLLALPAAVFAAEAPADKSAYTLFNRTPAAQLRELSTDRPDLTESAYTVDAGWWQVEMDISAYTHERDTRNGADTKASSLSYANMNVKVGLAHNIDLQTVFSAYTIDREDDRIAGTHDKASGFGDITSRLKINLWGNDGGDTAFALMPYIKWPTNQDHLGNQSVEGGLIAPLAVALPGGWGMGLMTEFDIVRNPLDDGYRLDWVNSITFSHDIAGNLGGYVELFTQLTEGPDLASFDCGLTYGIGDHVQIDCGANVGLTRATEDYTIFAGLAVRF